MEDVISVNVSAELKEKIAIEVAHESIKQGAQVSRSAWVRMVIEKAIKAGENKRGK